MEEKNRKVSFYTLGCKLNFAETSTIARQFEGQGYTRVDFSEAADVVVINTCSVTDHADKKCRQIIKKANTLNPQAYIAIVGCYSQLEPEKVSQVKGVDLVIGTQDKFRVAELVNAHKKNGKAHIHSCSINEVRGYNSSYSASDRTRSFLKVQDGCDYYCSFCTIPFARGKSRNSSIADVIENARKIASENMKEIVLTGVNIGDFGKTTNESFFDLLKALNTVDGIERIRISSIEPNLLTNEIIDFVASEKKLMPHFHIPLQSGSNKILSLMKRKYRRELYANRVSYIKKVLPHAFIGCDVIVGFPGESDDDFLDTFHFIENQEVSELHVFTYSDRPHALANKISSKVNPREKTRRSQALHELSSTMKSRFYNQFQHTKQIVLFEKQQSGNKIFGFTENYIKTETLYNRELAGNIVLVQLKAPAPSGNMEITQLNT